jgi:hypothetical protein
MNTGYSNVASVYAVVRGISERFTRFSVVAGTEPADKLDLR